MVNALSGLGKPANVEKEEDVITSFIKESGVYPGKVTMAYIRISQYGAVGIHMDFELTDNGNYSETLWVQKRESKAADGTVIPGTSTYTRDGKEYFIPGMATASSIVEIALGKEVNQLTSEEKMVELYDTKAKAKVPTKVPVLTELIGQPIALGLLKTIEDKNQLNKQTNKYEATGATRFANEIAKVFDGTTGLTANEKKAGATDPVFLNKWKDKNDGFTKDKSKAKAGEQSAGAATTKAAGRTTSMFGKKG